MCNAGSYERRIVPHCRDTGNHTNTTTNTHGGCNESSKTCLPLHATDRSCCSDPIFASMQRPHGDDYRCYSPNRAAAPFAIANATIAVANAPSAAENVTFADVNGASASGNATLAVADAPFAIVNAAFAPANTHSATENVRFAVANGRFASGNGSFVGCKCAVCTVSSRVRTFHFTVCSVRAADRTPDCRNRRECFESRRCFPGKCIRGVLA